MLVAACLLLPAVPTLAQTPYGVIHRPNYVKYDVLETEHFDLIFQRGLDTLVFEAARVLEESYVDIRAHTGFDRDFRMPVVLNDFSDISNGFVTAAPFRQEITAAPIKGKILSPRHSDWLNQVLPHEMVHAAQAEFKPGFGVGAILGVFSRDMERALNLGIPRGMSEGLAVVHESSEEHGYGRLNFSMTLMQYRAAVASGKGWSVGELLDPPAFTRPFDRYYTGGGLLTRFVEDSVRTDFFNRTLGFYNRIPIFGYGTALWMGTGRSPWSLSASFQRSGRESEEYRLASLGRLSEARILTDRAGLSCRRPVWLENERLVAHCSGYSSTPGFYTILPSEGKLRYAFRHSITEDRFFALSPDRRTISFSRYTPELNVPVSSHSAVHLIDVETGRETRIPDSDRFYAPVSLADGTVLALRDQGQFNAIWRFADRGRPVRLFGEFGTVIKEIVVAPDGQLFILANRSGEQALYSLVRSTTGWSLDPLVAVRDGSLYDPTVSPDGRFVVFSADPAKHPNLYAYSIPEGQVRQLTNVRFGALEPSVSPDGSHLAFVNYEHEQYQLALMDFSPDRSPLAAGFEPPTEKPRPFAGASLPGSDSLTANIRSYNPFPSALVPRAVAPFLLFTDDVLDPFDNDIELGLGATVVGADPLQQWSYSASGFYEASRMWGRATVQTGTNVLRPFVRVLNEPLSRNVAINDSTVVRIRNEERAAEVGVSLPFRFSRNVHATSMNLGLATEYRTLRLIDEESNPLSEFSRRLTVTPSAVLGYRLQSNIRDFIPNSGLLVATAAELDAYVSGQAPPSRASRTDASWFLPLMKAQNRGIRLIGGLLWQNRGSVVNTNTFLPRGYEDEVALGAGTFLKAGIEVVQPVAYVDRGLVLIPITLEGVYMFGFGESVLEWSAFEPLYSSVGLGVGARVRLFHNLRIDARIAISRLLEEEKWAVSYR